MSVHQIEQGHNAIADYALLLAEATGVLRDLAGASESQRSDEYEALLEIHAEGADLHRGVIVNSTDPYLNSLPAVLRGLFSTVMTLGEDISSGVPAPAGLDQLQTITRAISAALDRGEDSEFVDEKTAVIAAAVQQVDGSTVESTSATTALGRLTVVAEAALRTASGLAAGVAA